MPTGEIVYLGSAGGFRKRKVKLDPTMPIVVKNPKDHQAHALDEKPVHSILPPVRFTSMDDLLAADAPKDPVIVEKWGIVCADNAVWPLSPQSLDQYLSDRRTAVFGDSDDPETTMVVENGSLDDLRQLKYQEYVEEARQRGMHQASTADSKDALMGNVSVAMAIIACSALVLVGAILAWVKFGPEVTPDPTANMLFMSPALGLVGLKKRSKKGLNAPVIEAAEATSPPSPLRLSRLSKKDAWVTATVFDDKALGGKIWRAQMPYSVWLAAGIPETCIFRPDIPRMKKLGALLGGAVGVGVAFAVGHALLGPIIGGFAAAMVGPVGVGLGWLFGPIVLGNRPILMVARVPDDNNTRLLLPIEHNYCRTVSTGDYISTLETVLDRLNSPTADEDDGYEPTVFRGTRFYADLAATDVVEEFKSSSGMMQKLQIGMMAAMGFGSIGLLFFVVMATGS